MEKAQDLTCIELRWAVEEQKEAQLRAADAFVDQDELAEETQ